MAVLANTISGFVPSQVPAYIRDNYPNFVALLQQYFQFLENTANNGTVYQIRNLANYKNIDSTSPQFYQYFINEFLPFFPNQTAYSLQKLLKVATQFYQTKGSQNSIEFLFRVLYGLDSEIYYPKNNVLRLSAGQWNLPQALKLTLTGLNVGFNVQQLVGRQGVGSLSNTTCMIESVNQVIDPTLNQQIVEIFISNISDIFTPGESLNVIYGFAANGAPLLFSEPIIGSLSEIIIDPKNRGLSYVGTQFYANGTISFPGDPVSIIGGLGGSNLDIEAVAFVGNVTQGSVTGVEVDAGGYGYSVYPNTICTVVDAPGSGGSGANVIVSQVDTGNQVQLILNQDSIQYKLNVTIGANNYAFANTVSANLAQTFANALAYYPINVAPLKQLSVVSGGVGFTQVPSVNLRSMYDSDFSSNLFSTYQASPTQANFNNWITSRPNVADLGIMAAAQVLTGGQNYSATKDALYVDSEVGKGATYVLTVGGGGQITAASVSNGGFGYYSYGAPLMPQLFLANSANAAQSASGTGATFQAWGFNQGQILSLSVSTIGQILDIRLTNRGFDYVQTPLVSLRNMDVTINPIQSSQLYFQGDFIYQGANANVATFQANVDGFNRTTNVLRLYNYVGSINVSANLVGANFNSLPITANTYGDGKAKANAQFLGGLIDFPGFWLTTSGFLSADQKFQDSVEFHNYSYLIKVEKALSSYQQAVQNIVHPAGTRMLGLCTVTDIEPDAVASYAETIQTSNTSTNTGTVNTVSFSSVLPSPQNLLINPYMFNNATAWPTKTNVTITANANNFGVEPVATMSISETVASGVHSLQDPITIVAGATYTASIYAKANNATQGRYLYIQIDNSSAGGNNNGAIAVFDLVSGVANTLASGPGGHVFANSISQVGNTGWYFCTLTGNVDAVATAVRFSITQSVNLNCQWYPIYAGNTQNTTYIWGAQLIAGASVVPYANSLIVLGTGTSFNVSANVGSLITLLDAYPQTKVITAVLNANAVAIESNTLYFAPDRLKLTTGSSIVVTSGAGNANLGLGDVVVTNVAGNSQTSIVTAVTGNSVTLNTTFATNTVNVQYQVYPNTNSSAYIIFTPG